jgi:hypothetical protein
MVVVLIACLYQQKPNTIHQTPNSHLFEFEYQLIASNYSKKYKHNEQKITQEQK